MQLFLGSSNLRLGVLQVHTYVESGETFIYRRESKDNRNAMPNNLKFLVYSRPAKSGTILKSHKRMLHLGGEWPNETADKIYEEQRENILRVKTKRMKEEEYKLGTETD